MWDRNSQFFRRNRVANHICFWSEKRKSCQGKRKKRTGTILRLCIRMSNCVPTYVSIIGEYEYDHNRSSCHDVFQSFFFVNFNLIIDYRRRLAAHLTPLYPYQSTCESQLHSTISTHTPFSRNSRHSDTLDSRNHSQSDGVFPSTTASFATDFHSGGCIMPIAFQWLSSLERVQTISTRLSSFHSK